MLSNSNKKRNSDISENINFFQVAGIALLVGIVILTVANIKMFVRKQDLKAELISYQQKVVDLQKAGENLKQEIANSDNKDYLEKIAYEQGMARPGEKEIIFVAPKEKLAPPAPQQTSVWQKFLSWLKSKF